MIYSQVQWAYFVNTTTARSSSVMTTHYFEKNFRHCFVRLITREMMRSDGLFILNGKYEMLFEHWSNIVIVFPNLDKSFFPG